MRKMLVGAALAGVLLLTGCQDATHYVVIQQDQSGKPYNYYVVKHPTTLRVDDGFVSWRNEGDNRTYIPHAVAEPAYSMDDVNRIVKEYGLQDVRKLERDGQQEDD